MKKTRLKRKNKDSEKKKIEREFKKKIESLPKIQISLCLNETSEGFEYWYNTGKKVNPESASICIGTINKSPNRNEMWVELQCLVDALESLEEPKDCSVHVNGSGICKIYTYLLRKGSFNPIDTRKEFGVVSPFYEIPIDLVIKFSRLMKVHKIFLRYKS